MFPRTALRAIGLVVLGAILLGTLLSMGPIGWFAIGTMLVIGILQVHSERRGARSDAEDAPRFCAHCGAELDPAFAAADGADDGEFETNYCNSCGAPVTAPTPSRSPPDRRNCPECGSLNDADDPECGYCGADL